MEGHNNTYGGLNKDTAFDSLKPEMYIDALDIRISTDKGESQGAFTNMQGNLYSFTIPTSGTFNDASWNITAPGGTPEVIGYGTVRDSIILFVADDLGFNGWIYKVEYNPATRQIIAGVPILLYYSSTLNFKKQWPIEALGRYENNATQRIYWTDYNNIFRTINIADPELATFNVNNIDIYPNVEYSQPILESVTGGGQLNSGMYQIGYRLITSDGKETLVSPPSNMIHIVSASETASVPQYVGEPQKINTLKAINIDIDTTNYLGNFQKIEFLSLYYENESAAPIAVSIESKNIVSNLTSLVYTGVETTTFNIELFTFITKNFPFKTFKSVTQKDNYLVGANVKSSTISVQDLLEGTDTFDATVGRYNSGGSLPHALTGTPAAIAEKKLKNAFNVSTSLDATQGYNTDAHWDSAWHTGKQYRYKSNGTTLGGEGANISYTFHLEPATIDVENQAKYHNIGGNIKYGWDSHDLNDGYGVYPNPSFANPASPHISGLLRGYKRGETYRFGIIFYTLKGEATYVEYIGDIKFPDISEQTDDNPANVGPFHPLCLDTHTYAGFDGGSVGFNLGIKFSITLPASLSSKIESYQIVRVPRTSIDKRRLCTGILSPLGFQSVVKPTGPPTPYDFDFRVNGQESVVHPFNAQIIEDNSNTGKDVDLDYDSLSCFIDQQDSQTDTIVNGVNIANVNVRSQHLSFFSPEISYNFEDTVGIGDNPGSNAGFLMTGYYSHTYNGGASPIDVIQQKTTSPASGPEAQELDSNIGGDIFDYGKKFRTCLPLTFNSVENLKKLRASTYFDMRDSTNVTLDTKTASWGLTADNNGNAPVATTLTGGKRHHRGTMTGPSYMRNYYVYTATLNASTTPYLNDPVAGRGIARAGSNISALVGQYKEDPLTNVNLVGAGKTISSKDYFHVLGNTGSSDPGRIQARNKAGTGFNTPNDAIPIADLIIPKTEVYGGASISALEANNFIPASPVIDKANLTPIVYGGDIFISCYSLQKMMIEFNSKLYDNGSSTYIHPISRTDLVVIESCVNLNLHNGANPTTGIKFTYGSTPVESEIYRQEDNNTFSDFGKFNLGEDKYRFYAYNEVFSKKNTEVLFFIKPSNLIDLSLTNDVRAFLSGVKINGEVVDSWTQFAINDYYDVDDHGPINKILNFKNNVYFFQDQATGVYSINREAVTTTNDGAPTELGTSKGFGKHQYYSTEIGSIHQWAVAATNNAIYFFDGIHRKIYQMGQGTGGLQTSPLSELKGMHSYLQSLGDDVFIRKALSATPTNLGGDNPIILKGAHIGIDEVNDEVIFTFLSTVTRGSLNSIVFDELANQFSTRLSINPKMWINNGDTLITSNTISAPTNLTNKMYIHNIGSWGNFYDIVRPCELTLVINPKADVNKVLRFLEFNSIVREVDPADNSKTIDRTKTITGFKIKTETQASNDIYKTSPESLTKLKRRFDKWRIKLPRDHESTSKKGRFRSTHFLVTLYFDNTYNKELIVNKLTSYYDLQIF